MPVITRELNMIARCGLMFRSEALKEAGLTAVQSPYLLHLCHRPGQTQEELARALHVNRSNAARQLAQLEEAGYITREPRSDDRRALSVYPTQRAREAAPMIRRVNAMWQDYLTQDMTAQEKALLSELLERMRRRAIAWEEEGRP